MVGSRSPTMLLRKAILYWYLLGNFSVTALAPPKFSPLKIQQRFPKLPSLIQLETPLSKFRIQERIQQIAPRKPLSISKRNAPTLIPPQSPSRRLQFATIIFALTALGNTKIASALSKVAAAGTDSIIPAPLGMRNVATAFSMLALVGGLGLTRLGLRGLAGQLMVACARCTLQLQLLGGLILQWLLPSSQPWLIGSWVVGVGMIAAQESYGRLEYTYPKLRRHLTLSFLIGGLLVLGACIFGNILGKMNPWYHPPTLIPVAGMLFGNTLSAVTLAGSTLTRSFAMQKTQVELWLARGATYEEAILPLSKTSIQTALMPTINALSVTGIVHIPGMMTGQILAGQSPSQAAIYQILIWFLIASVATCAVQLLNAFVTRTLVNTRQHRLNLDGLRNKRATIDDIDETEIKPAIITKATLTSASSKTPALRVENLFVERANVNLTLDLMPGDRVGITGPSGIGKSQIFRTIVGLEPVQSTNGPKQRPVLEVKGAEMSRMLPPEWRTKVCLVSQDRPTEAGTPREFLEQVQKFRFQTQRKIAKKQRVVNGDGINPVQDPIKVASKEWDLPVAIWDRPWSTLSGGEAQRASLAIALSLEPEVLLLDEMSSALDVVTTLRVEKTLQRLGIPLIVVTHDQYQLERFCTHHIELPTGKTEQISNRP